MASYPWVTHRYDYIEDGLAVSDPYFTICHHPILVILCMSILPHREWNVFFESSILDDERNWMVKYTLKWVFPSLEKRKICFVANYRPATNQKATFVWIYLSSLSGAKPMGYPDLTIDSIGLSKFLAGWGEGRPTLNRKPGSELNQQSIPLNENHFLPLKPLSGENSCLAYRLPETKRRDRRCISSRGYYGFRSRSREKSTFNQQSTYFC